MSAGAVVVVLTLSQASVWDAGVFTTAGSWKVEEAGPPRVSSRPVAGTPYFEYRVELDDPAGTVAGWCELVFEWGSKGTDQPGLTQHRLVQDGADERVVYHRIVQPIVKNRDYTFTVARRREPDGTCRIRFLASNHLGPAADPSVVRMDRLWGSWTFAPRAAGGVLVTYTMFADPAGTVPPFLVHGSQRAAARDSVRQALGKLHATPPADR